MVYTIKETNKQAIAHLCLFGLFHSIANQFKSLGRQHVSIVTANGESSKRRRTQVVDANAHGVTAVSSIVSIVRNPQVGDFLFHLVVDIPTEAEQESKDNGKNDEIRPWHPSHVLEEEKGVARWARFMFAIVFVLHGGE